MTLKERYSKQQALIQERDSIINALRAMCKDKPKLLIQYYVHGWNNIDANVPCVRDFWKNFEAESDFRLKRIESELKHLEKESTPDNEINIHTP
jgi:hypothetical protein